MQNQNGNKTPPHTSAEWQASKGIQITNVGEDVKKRELSYIVGWNVNYAATLKTV